MANYDDLVGRVERAFGGFDAGFDDSVVYEHFRDILRYDIPAVVGGMYREGIKTLSVGGGAYVADGSNLQYV